MKRKDYKEMVWQKTRQIRTSLGKCNTPVYTPVYTNVIHRKNTDTKIIHECNEDILSQIRKLSKDLKKSMGKNMGRSKVFSFRVPYGLMLILKELKEIIGGSLAGIIRMAIIHLYADIKKGVDLWQ